MKKIGVYKGPELKQHPLDEADCLQLAKTLQTTKDDKLTEVIIAFLKSKGKNNFGNRNYRPDIRAYLMTNDFYGITSNRSRELSIDEIRQRTHAVLSSTIQKLEKTLEIKWRYWNKYPGRDEFDEDKSVDEFCNSTSVTGIKTIHEAQQHEQIIPALVRQVNFDEKYPYVIVILGKDNFGSRIFAKVSVNHSKHLHETLPKDATARGIIIPYEVFRVEKDQKKRNSRRINGSSPGII